MMGNKIDAKKIMDETGVPTVKGINDLIDKNKIEEKERVKIMEKKGVKNMKIRFFN